MSYPAATVAAMFRMPVLDPDPSGRGWMSAQDRLWISDAPPPPGGWATLQAQHDRTGWWPLLLSALSDRDPERPWLSGELAPSGVPTSAPGDHDAVSVLAGWWRACVPEAEQSATTDPFGSRWPGLARPGTPQADPSEHAAEAAGFLLSTGWLTGPRLGLAPAARGADAPTAVGWSGPVNHEQDIAKFSTVLRSWEDRFGARLIGLGFDTLHLSIAAPPVDEEHALHVAAEHFAFCPDNVWQGSGSLREYAKALLDQPLWAFWWD